MGIQLLPKDHRSSLVIIRHKGLIQFSTPVNCWSPALPLRGVLTGGVEEPVIFESATFTSAGRSELCGSMGDEGPEAGAGQV